MRAGKNAKNRVLGRICLFRDADAGTKTRDGHEGLSRVKRYPSHRFGRFQKTWVAVAWRVLGGAQGPALLKALTAKDRPALCGAKGDGGLLAALRTGGLGFRAHGRRPATTPFGAFRLAGFATFGLVLKALIGEEHLFAGRKNKLSATLRALQDPIVVFHEPLSPGP
jgi:hypothetical protein